ncbi:MAG: hypothetical protein CM15mP42_04730 [Methanobacteriota archaeon]|nr:MAG: hypothetical protein CM15mP42_04730 [Euryarchaeota archaeon]
MNLNDYHDKAVIELMSPFTQNIVGDTHDMEVKE